MRKILTQDLEIEEEEEERLLACSGAQDGQESEVTRCALLLLYQ